MLKAVDLNDQPHFPTQEINHIGTKGNLARELVTVQPTIAQLTPRPIFLLRFVLAQSTGLVSLAGPSFHDVGGRHSLAFSLSTAINIRSGVAGVSSRGQTL